MVYYYYIYFGREQDHLGLNDTQDDLYLCYNICYPPQPLCFYSYFQNLHNLINDKPLLNLLQETQWEFIPNCICKQYFVLHIFYELCIFSEVDINLAKCFRCFSLEFYTNKKYIIQNISQPMKSFEIALCQHSMG